MALIQHIYQKERSGHCVHNRDIFARLKEEFKDLEVREMTPDSPEAQQLVKQFNISVFPATIVEGNFYRSGGVDEGELREILEL